jgi:hypothetical protein
MSIILDILGELLLASLRIAIEVPLIWLGEIVRWGVTLGAAQAEMGLLYGRIRRCFRAALGDQSLDRWCRSHSFWPFHQTLVLFAVIQPNLPNKTDAGSGSHGICSVIGFSRSPSTDPQSSPNR